MRSLVESSPQTSASLPAQTAVSDTAGVILVANGLRKGFMVQNTGTTILYLAMGSAAANPTATAYHVALKECAVSNDGTGGVYIDDAWVGEVRAIGSAVGGTCVVTEFRLGATDWNKGYDWGNS